MLKIALGALVVLASACTPTSPTTNEVYTCRARNYQIGAFLATDPALPTIWRLPSLENVYFDYRGRDTHVDGPICVEGR